MEKQKNNKKNLLRKTTPFCLKKQENKKEHRGKPNFWPFALLKEITLKGARFP